MNGWIVAGLGAAALAPLYAWAFVFLPRERWQILATLPVARREDGEWRGVNLTWYGLLIGCAMAAGTALALLLAGAANRPLAYPALALILLLGVSVPAASVVNRIVEGHWHGFTVGGAAFAGMSIGPWLLWLTNRWLFPESAEMETWLMVGALAPAYALGEGIGRLACISFGCCYGRRLDACPRWMQRLFARGHFVFRGALKKAAVESDCEGVPLVPIQAVTAILSSLAGLIGMALFLNGRLAGAFAVPILVTQLWRFFSEFLRADYRGGGRVSAYQRMAALAALAAGITWLLAPGAAGEPLSVAAGLRLLWTPGAMLLVQAVGWLGFLRMGVSSVTAARIRLIGTKPTVA